MRAASSSVNTVEWHGFGPMGGIMHVGALLPLRYRLRVYIVALGQLRQAFLTSSTLR
jgi:hypothetical protein